MKKLFENKVILITGGLGSIGSAILEQLLEFGPKQVRVLDNRETELYYSGQKYSKYENVRFLYGDVRDKERMSRATKGVDILFHAAALKHVFLCEYDPFEAVKTNVVGTQNLIEVAMSNKVKKMLFISTDKAVNPSNVMGATKLLAERLIGSMYHHKGTSITQFGSVRFGNVLASRGSVLETWNDQLKKGENITVTDPDMTRFFMTIPESIKLIFHAAELAENGETFIFKMNSVRLGDLAEAFLESKDKPRDHIKIIGKRSGEKMHEELIFESEKEYLLENDELFVRIPLIQNSEEILKKFKKKGFTQTETKEFISSSKKLLLDQKTIIELLANAL